MLAISTYPFLLDVAISPIDMLGDALNQVTPIALPVLLVVILLIIIFKKINKK